MSNGIGPTKPLAEMKFVTSSVQVLVSEEPEGISLAREVERKARNVHTTLWQGGGSGADRDSLMRELADVREGARRLREIFTTPYQAWLNEYTASRIFNELRRDQQDRVLEAATEMILREAGIEDGEDSRPSGSEPAPDKSGSKRPRGID